MDSNTSEKKSGLLQRSSLSPALYLVATPIGNLRDISLRALDVLSSVDMIACEDTRVSGKLLKAYDIRAKTMAYHDHSDEKARKKITDLIEEEKSVALISDAGMPLISDPGYKLVKTCRDLGLMVTTIPGANAVLSALQLSGLPGENFSFIGFLPHKQKARQNALGEWASVKGLLITYESAARLQKTLRDIFEILGDRPVSVVREITKLYEEARSANVSDLIAHYEDKGAPKGEIVLVIGPKAQEELSQERVSELLKQAMQTMRVKEAAAYVAVQTGWSKSVLYDMALLLKNE